MVCFPSAEVDFDLFARLDLELATALVEGRVGERNLKRREAE
jgi:hypothetical protein